MASPLDAAMRALARRPQLAVVVGGGIAVGAVLLARSQTDAGTVTDVADTGDGSPDVSSADPTDGSGLASDPFATPFSNLPSMPDGSGDGPATTPEGCTLPVPPVPANLAGRYLYVCRAGVWTLVPKPPQLSPGGCPLPVPRLDPVASAAGLTIVCDGTTHSWQYRRKPGHGPGTGRPGPSVALSPGPHRLYDVKAGKHGRLHALAAGVGSVRPPRAAVWSVAGAPTNVEVSRDDGSPVASARMVHIHDAAAGAANGRWLELDSGATYSSRRARDDG